MRKFTARLVDELGGTEPLWTLYQGIRQAWIDSGDYYRKHRLRDGAGLTGVRHDHLNRKMQDVCDRYPGWFPAFDFDRRRSRVFALVERNGLTVSAAISRNRAEWVDAAALRLDANRQMSLLNPPTQISKKKALVALLMITNGSPRARAIRDRPRDVVIKYLVGDKQYASEEFDLDALFAKRFEPIIAVPNRQIFVPSQPSPRSVSVPSGVKREAAPKKRPVRIKPAFAENQITPSPSDLR